LCMTCTAVSGLNEVIADRNDAIVKCQAQTHAKSVSTQMDSHVMADYKGLSKEARSLQDDSRCTQDTKWSKTICLCP
jgi:hypothetical protein